MQFVPLLEDCNTSNKVLEIEVLWRDENPIMLKTLFDYLLIKPRIIYELEYKCEILFPCSS
jgi:hypothetical protein